MPVLDLRKAAGRLKNLELASGQVHEMRGPRLQAIENVRCLANNAPVQKPTQHPLRSLFVVSFDPFSGPRLLLYAEGATIQASV